MWMQDDCRVYMDSYTASNGSCFMVTWTMSYSQKPPLGGRPNTKPFGDHGTSSAHKPIGLFYFIMCEDPHEEEFIEIAFSWGPGHIWLHTTLGGPWPHYMILEVCWDGLWTLSYGLSQSHGRGSWLVCEVALNFKNPWPFIRRRNNVERCLKFITYHKFLGCIPWGPRIMWAHLSFDSRILHIPK